MSKMVSKFALAAGLALALVFTFGCAGNPPPPPKDIAVEKSTFTDSRNGKTYRTVKIEELVWMAENLNYDAQGSQCYDNKPENCEKYGRLYNWNSAMQSCPDGWLMPRKEEWQNLWVLAGSGEIAGKRLKATAGWGELNGQSGNGTDNYSFSALPGGYSDSGQFKMIDTYGGWWSANVSEYKTVDAKANYELRNKAYDYFILSNNITHSNLAKKSDSRSVRCVQDKRVRITDPRDGKTYKIVQIGTQTWMAENLNYETEGSKCFGEGGQSIVYERDEKGRYKNNILEKITLPENEVQANCAKYGRLYNWNTAAKGICPSGWHLPTNEEWETLENFVGGKKIAGEKLKAMSGWNRNGNGTDNYGFSALPAGGSDTTSTTETTSTNYSNIGDFSLWWSASEGINDSVYYYVMIDEIDAATLFQHKKDALSSVRCLKD